MKASPIDDFIYLIGRPPVADCVRFSRCNAVDFKPGEDESRIAEAWRRAREHLRKLESTESGIADSATLEPLPDEMLSIAERALQSIPAQRARQYVRNRQWHIIDLDRTVIFQKHINLRFANELKALLSPTPAGKELMQFAAGESSRSPKVTRTQARDGTFYFSSASNDLQFLDVLAIDPVQVSDYQPSGHAAAAVIFYVGFGSNFINAFRANGRVVLSNGSHRAYALRALGIRRVPCLVAEPDSDDELDLVMPAEVKQDRHQYLVAPRPPLFKDYFDQSLGLIVHTARTHQVLQLQFTLNRIDTPTA